MRLARTFVDHRGWRRAVAAAASSVFTALGAGGAPVGSEFQVNTTTAHHALTASVAADDQGGFVVVWESTSNDGQDGSGYGVLARRFDSSGSALGQDFQVNSYTSGHQKRPDVAMDSDGDFVVVWVSNTPSVQYRLFAQRFSSTGSRVAVEFQVSTKTLAGEIRGRVETNASGDFAIAWDSSDGDDLGVLARRFSSTGEPVAEEFVVNSHTPVGNTQSSST